MAREKRPVFAKKSFGQNFLTDETVIDRIVAAVAPEKGETIVEIGPGRGALTSRLLGAGARVVAIEVEREMIAVLKREFGLEERLTLIESDALKVDFHGLSATFGEGKPLRLVANLPYYISTAILQKLIDERAKVSEMILMFQREVVERITALVGDKNRGFLTVMTERYLASEKLFDVPPGAFRPAPKVWSAVVRLITRPEEIETVENDGNSGDELFRRLVSDCFLQKRKTILNNLKASALVRNHDVAATLEKTGIEPSRRAETLSLAEWRALESELRGEIVGLR